MMYDQKPWLKSYDPNVQAEIEIPDRSLVDRFNEIAKQYPQNVAAHFLGECVVALEQQNPLAHPSSSGLQPCDARVSVPVRIEVAI